MVEGTVHVVDDDLAIRDSLKLLFEGEGYATRTYATAAAFLAARGGLGAGPHCVVLDIRMPGMSGLELQRHLSEAGPPMQVVFLTAHGDVATAVGAVKAGAVDFLEKPFRDEDLLARVREALDSDRHALLDAAERARARDKLGSLTPRERQVLEGVVAGASNKALARSMGVSRRTVEVHRAHLMEKMGCHSIPELVLAAVAAGMASAAEPRPVNDAPGDASGRSVPHSPSR